MVQINFAQKTVNVKIVYYGPGMSGKTTNLEVVHQRAPDNNRGELTSISTDGDRTLFFDYMPLDLGTVAGMRTCFQIYTVPGQVYYNSTRKLVLQGVDGIIFVADSGESMLDQNIESLRNLEENLNEYGKSLSSLPHVLQWNKRDLPDAMSVEELGRHMNQYAAPTFEAIANTGQGVFPTLKALAALVLKNIMKETTGGGSKSGAPASRPAASAPAPAPRSAAPAPRAPQPSAQAPAASGSLDLKMASAQTAAASHSSPAELMRSQPTPSHASAPTASPRKASSPARRPAHRPRPTGAARPGSKPSRPKSAAAPPRKKKRSGVFTGVFVLAAAGVGAALAWFLLSL